MFKKPCPMRIKYFVKSTLIFTLALVTFLPFLSTLRPLFPLFVSILLFIFGILSVYKKGKAFNAILGIISFLALFYFVFPFKIEWVEDWSPDNEFFKDSKSNITIAPYSTSLLFPGHPQGLEHQKYVYYGDVFTPMDPKYAILIRKILR